MLACFNSIEYDGMTMERVDRPTAECAAALDNLKRNKENADEKIADMKKLGDEIAELDEKVRPI